MFDYTCNSIRLCIADMTTSVTYWFIISIFTTTKSPFNLVNEFDWWNDAIMHFLEVNYPRTICWSLPWDRWTVQYKRHEFGPFKWSVKTVTNNHILVCTVWFGTTKLRVLIRTMLFVEMWYNWAVWGNDAFPVYISV